MAQFGTKDADLSGCTIREFIDLDVDTHTVWCTIYYVDIKIVVL
jgi:hypothetical protein